MDRLNFSIKELLKYGPFNNQIIRNYLKTGQVSAIQFPTVVVNVVTRIQNKFGGLLHLKLVVTLRWFVGGLYFNISCSFSSNSRSGMATSHCSSGPQAFNTKSKWNNKRDDHCNKFGSKNCVILIKHCHYLREILFL